MTITIPKGLEDEFAGLMTTNTVGSLKSVTIEGMLKAKADIQRLKKDLLKFTPLVPMPLFTHLGPAASLLCDMEWRTKMLGHMLPTISPMYGLSAIMDIPSPRFMRLRRSLFRRTIGRTK